MWKTFYTKLWCNIFYIEDFFHFAMLMGGYYVNKGEIAKAEALLASLVQIKEKDSFQFNLLKQAITEAKMNVLEM